MAFKKRPEEIQEFLQGNVAPSTKPVAAASEVKAAIEEKKAPPAKAERKSTAKKSNPDYKAYLYYMRKDLHLKTKLEAIENGEEIGDIIDRLLEEHHAKRGK